uniref:ATP-dependent RNA helicase SUV3 homolog, mitochondrial n=3 Tax=Parascaris univalens TaxID=6257 RepID=A0A915BX29_PARUN
MVLEAAVRSPFSTVSSLSLFLLRLRRLQCVARYSREGNAAGLHTTSVDRTRTGNKGAGARLGRSAGTSNKKPVRSIEDLVTPVSVPVPKFCDQDDGLGGIVDPVDSISISMVLNEFSRRPLIRQLAEENGMNAKLFMTAFRSFRTYCLTAKPLDPAIAVTLSDIVKQGQDVDSLFVYFLSHARKVYPHLESIEDLRMISDLTQPHNWYPEARTIHRRIIFHAGPTNSGKTYEALKRFREAKSGVYCGPLKLLASEVFFRTNEQGVKCDMVTGEERRYAIDNHHPSAHLSSTVEMLSTQMHVDVAVIDEIQMLRDEQRGWAWTRALLGVAADEVHLCGEASAVNIVRELLNPIGEHVEVREYKRKTSLSLAAHALATLDNVQDGDCIVCFSRRAIFSVTKQLEKIGVKPAVIYGDLPPGTKLSQAGKFNDPNDATNVLVATDAIGMGLNLNIRRIIFYSLIRPPNGELIPNYAALQIAGRAGRFGTVYEEGKVMTVREEDMGILKEILSQPVSAIESVGIAPTFEQLETFSFHLPNASFINLLDIFVSVCSITDRFFICTVNQMKSLAELIDYIPLPLKVRYTFCIAPVNPDEKLAASAFVKMARRFSSGQALTYDWLCGVIGWPVSPAEKLIDLVRLEQIYGIVDVYLWLSLRFPDMFPDETEVRTLERQLDLVIEDGVTRIIELLGVDNAKEASEAKKLAEKMKTEEEKAEFEDSLEDAVAEEEVNEEGKQPLKLPGKRKGKRKSISDVVMARGVITAKELEELRAEVRREEAEKLRRKK